MIELITDWERFARLTETRFRYPVICEIMAGIHGQVN